MICEFNHFIIQLAEAKKETSQAVTRLKEIEAELAASRDRCEQQAKDLLSKSSRFYFIVYLVHKFIFRDQSLLI